MFYVPESNLFFIIKAFAAGVILSTGFVHVLLDGSEDLTSPCLNEKPWGKFLFAGMMAMCYDPPLTFSGYLGWSHMDCSPVRFQLPLLTSADPSI
ncbi:hypothetical protein V6N11_024395 [Hibiscus sabdariffa]|uniref:Uncharacterized protein n=1 Tax=Hibiscus sabdariffa TaxID=183260 RepID=A0ABR2NF05_9ROSI